MVSRGKSPVPVQESDGLGFAYSRKYSPQRLGRQCFRDKQLARPAFKSLSAEIDFDTGGRELRTIRQKFAKRLFVLKTVNIEALAVVPANVNAWEVALRGTD